MGAVATSLVERVTSIFDDLGYTVSGTGPRLRAERKWRVVTISLGQPDSLPESGEFHCFVAQNGQARQIYRELAAVDPEYEWAVLHVPEEEDVEFLRPPGRRESDPIVT